MGSFFVGFEKQAVESWQYKPRYKVTDINTLDPHKEDEAWTAKIDGAHSVVHLEKGKLPRLFSHRVSKRTGDPIEYTQKLPHIESKSKTDAVVRAEVFGLDPKGKVIHPEKVTAMLNSGVTKSLQMQTQEGIRTQTALIDVEQYKGKDMTSASYGEKRRILEEIARKHSDFVLPAIATSPEEKAKLLKDIRAGKHPQTKEGVIVHNISQPQMPFAKAKIISDHDVYIRRVFPEESTKPGRKQMAGGFGYSWDPAGPVVGRVGTGLSHEMKTDMLKNPEKYIGMVARVKALDISKDNVLMKPSFKDWHVEKNIDREELVKQTVIVNKSIATNREQAQAIAKQFADRLYTSRETGQSYRFRQKPPEVFKDGSFRTSKVAPGVSIVYGKLKKSEAD
jgi:ATP-dependent DNA ligase